MTTRGATTSDFQEIGEFLVRARDIALEVQQSTGKKLVDFTRGLDGHEGLEQLRAEVQAWASLRPYPS